MAFPESLILVDFFGKLWKGDEGADRGETCQGRLAVPMQLFLCVNEGFALLFDFSP